MPISPRQCQEMQIRLARSGRDRAKADFAEACAGVEPQPRNGLAITIAGHILGGKNHINITRTGHRYPNKAWAAWRDDAVSQVRCQLPAGFKPFDQPVNMRLAYHAGDRRRRDMPAILDSIFHVLERAGVVADDTLIWVTSSSRDYDKARPRACIVLEGKFLKIGA